MKNRTRASARPCRSPPSSYGFRAAWSAVLALALAGGPLVAGEVPVGPFVESDFPFIATQLDLGAAAPRPASPNMVVRGIVVPLGGGLCVAFDQELLRIAGVWTAPADAPPFTLTSLAQASYADGVTKGGGHPVPTGALELVTGMHPGVGIEVGDLTADPRAAGRPGDAGRGPLPEGLARFDGIEVAGPTAILHYRRGSTAIAERYERATADGAPVLVRRLRIDPHAQPLRIAIGRVPGQAWAIGGDGATAVAAGHARVASAPATVTLALVDGELVAVVPAADRDQEVAIVLASGPARAPLSVPAHAADARRPAPRWPTAVPGRAETNRVAGNGLALDAIRVPQDNPWHRRVRPADLAFLDRDRALVVTYDGDVWQVSGLSDPALSRLSWRRFASGLHEPLAIVMAGGAPLVATKNGLVRLEDRDGDGEADWYGNFSDAVLQSQTTRSFPLDLAVAPDGSLLVTQGGITNATLDVGGTGTGHCGTILRIAPDGRSVRVLASHMREPFIAVNPADGTVTATDQQGNYIPSSVCYQVRDGDAFGFGENPGRQPAPPLVWIPHEADSSCASQVWVGGAGMGAWNGRLLHLSYGTGRLFLIAPDRDAPTPQGAVIPLGFETRLPLLHARMHPDGNAVFGAGFRIYDSKADESAGLCRLRPLPTPIVTPVTARSFRDGVVLGFAGRIDPRSVHDGSIVAKAWNYRRSKSYGSGRYALDGTQGSTPLPVGLTVPSQDATAALAHIPDLPTAMQIEIDYDLRLVDSTPARGSVYLTVNAPRTIDLAALGFPGVDFRTSHPTVGRAGRDDAAPPTAEEGRRIAATVGCIACHSSDGREAGLSGPTWKGLFGNNRTFADGSSLIADAAYVRESILEPQKRIVAGREPTMPAYAGVLSDHQIAALTAYIESLH